MEQLAPFLRKPVPITLDNGNTVYLRRLTAADYVYWQEWKSEKSIDPGAQLLVLSLCDDKGNRALRDTELEVAKQIDLVTLRLLSDEIYSLNGLTRASASPAPTLPPPSPPSSANPEDDTKKKPELASDSTNSLDA